MRILFTAYSGLGKGGAEISMLLLAQALKEKGHEIVIASNGNYEGFKNYNLGNSKKWVLFGLQDKYLAKKISKIARIEEVDIIHAHDRLTIPGAILAAKKMGVPVVTHYRDYWFCCPRSVCLKPSNNSCEFCSFRDLLGCSSLVRLPWNYYKLAHLRRLRKLLNSADLKIGISNFVSKKLDKWGVSKVKPIPNPVEINKFDIKVKKEKEVVISFIGHFDYIKGITEVIDAIIPILVNDKTVKFWIVGDGELKEKIIKKIKEEKLENQIKILGKIDYSKIPEIYALSDIIVYPSIMEETFGRVAVEAMVAGKPVIGSNKGGIKDIILDEKTGYLVDPLDKNEWTKKINKLVKDEKLRIRLGKNGKKEAKKYGMNEIARQVENEYKHIKKI